MLQMEESARQNIDQLLSVAGWSVCDPKYAYITAPRGMFIREYPFMYCTVSWITYIKSTGIHLGSQPIHV